MQTRVSPQEHHQLTWTRVLVSQDEPGRSGQAHEREPLVLLLCGGRVETGRGGGEKRMMGGESEMDLPGVVWGKDKKENVSSVREEKREAQDVLKKKYKTMKGTRQ